MFIYMVHRRQFYVIDIPTLTFTNVIYLNIGKLKTLIKVHIIIIIRLYNYYRIG